MVSRISNITVSVYYIILHYSSLIVLYFCFTVSYSLVYICCTATEFIMMFIYYMALALSLTYCTKGISFIKRPSSWGNYIREHYTSYSFIILKGKRTIYDNTVLLMEHITKHELYIDMNECRWIKESGISSLAIHECGTDRISLSSEHSCGTDWLTDCPG